MWRIITGENGRGEMVVFAMNESETLEYWRAVVWSMLGKSRKNKEKCERWEAIDAAINTQAIENKEMKNDQPT